MEVSSIGDYHPIFEKNGNILSKLGITEEKIKEKTIEKFYSETIIALLENPEMLESEGEKEIKLLFISFEKQNFYSNKVDILDILIFIDSETFQDKYILKKDDFLDPINLDEKIDILYFLMVYFVYDDFSIINKSEFLLSSNYFFNNIYNKSLSFEMNSQQKNRLEKIIEKFKNNDKTDIKPEKEILDKILKNIKKFDMKLKFSIKGNKLGEFFRNFIETDEINKNDNEINNYNEIHNDNEIFNNNEIFYYDELNNSYEILNDSGNSSNNLYESFENKLLEKEYNQYYADFKRETYNLKDIYNIKVEIHNFCKKIRAHVDKYPDNYDLKIIEEEKEKEHLTTIIIRKDENIFFYYLYY